MELALYTGIEVVAGPDAPPRAVCPSCGEPVQLCTFDNDGSSAWYYRHVRGAGAECQDRVKPLIDDSTPDPFWGDPYQAIATQSVVDAVTGARAGDIPAMLSLAFSPLVYAVLDTVQLSPEEVLEGLFPTDSKRSPPPVIVTNEETRVLWALQVHPGPVFDIRQNSTAVEELANSPWYIPLYPIGPAKMRMVQWVMRRVERVYVLGDHSLWSQVVADPPPGPVVGNVAYERETPRETCARSWLQ